MALADSSIKKLNDELNKGRSSLETFRREVSKEHLDEIFENENYSLFVSETPIGSELNDKLLKLLEIAENVGNDIEKLLKTTQDFSDVQRRLNSNNDMGVGATTNYVPTTVTASQAANGGVGVTISSGMVNIPGGTSIPSSAVTGGGH